MDDFEKLWPVADAVERETGRRPHPATLARWRLRGIKGVRISTVRLGGLRMCSRRDVQDFVTATTAAASGDAPLVRTNRQREAAVAKAERALKDLGV